MDGGQLPDLLSYGVDIPGNGLVTVTQGLRHQVECMGELSDFIMV